MYEMNYIVKYGMSGWSYCDCLIIIVIVVVVFTLLAKSSNSCKNKDTTKMTIKQRWTSMHVVAQEGVPGAGRS